MATVSNLTIYAQQAVLRVPGNESAASDDRRTLGEARGDRAATFDGGVRALRGRLEALGPTLRYDESTGLGTLSGGADVTIAPADEDDDATVITAEGIEFDVDTDRSRSFGDVVLVDGNQRATADAMLFAEDQDLGCLTNDPGGDGLPSIVRTDEDGSELVITAERICVLTGDETLHATGSVTVVDGDITSTGDEVFYDDTLQVAEVYGAPAVSVQGGSRLEAARIRQNIEFDFVEQLPRDAPTPFDPAAFEFADPDDGSDDGGGEGEGGEGGGDEGEGEGGRGGEAVGAIASSAHAPRSDAAPGLGTSPYTDV